VTLRPGSETRNETGEGITGGDGSSMHVKTGVLGDGTFHVHRLVLGLWNGTRVVRSYCERCSGLGTRDGA